MTDKALLWVAVGLALTASAAAAEDIVITKGKLSAGATGALQHLSVTNNRAVEIGRSASLARSSGATSCSGRGPGSSFTSSPARRWTWRSLARRR